MSTGVTNIDQLTTREFLDLLALQARTDPLLMTDADWRPIERAIMLAPTLEICKALLRGERVPLSRLNQDAVRRYGIRRAG